MIQINLTAQELEVVIGWGNGADTGCVYSLVVEERKLLNRLQFLAAAAHQTRAAELLAGVKEEAV